MEEEAPSAGVESSHLSALRLEGLCWLVMTLALAGGALAQTVLPSADALAGAAVNVSPLARFVPFIFYVLAFLVGVLLLEVRRQSRLELGLCWANARLEKKLSELRRRRVANA